MRIVLACDHRGYDAKTRALALLRQQGHEVCDLGCHSTAAVDYPDLAAPAARAVANKDADVAILFDGSGIGMNIVANRFPGVRAGMLFDEVTARRGREQNHLNVACIGTDMMGEEQIRGIVNTFLAAVPEDGRHARRVAAFEAMKLL